MAKFQAILTTEEGTDLSADNQRVGANPKYALLEPGYYTATVKKIKDNTWRGTYKRREEPKDEMLNPKAADGKWTFAKVEVQFEIVNEIGSLLNKHMTVGIVDDETGALIRPEGGSEKLIWGGDQGALFFFSAIGLIKKIDEKRHEMLPVDTNVISDRVLTIRVAPAGYIKGGKNFNPAQLVEELTKFNGAPYTFAQLPALVERYNQEKNLTGESILRVRNEITGYYPLRAQQVVDGSFFHDADTGAVYTNEAAFITERELNEMAESGDAPSDW